MFCGVTLPPYRILMAAAVLLSQPVAMHERIARCTATACSVVRGPSRADGPDRFIGDCDVGKILTRQVRQACA